MRHWCRRYTEHLDFQHDYQAWVVAEFSAILCVDEVYQDRLALLLAVDPRAPDGDRLIGYQLVHGPSVGQEDVRQFLDHLREVGIAPKQVVTDGSPLYPRPLATVWPQAAHQLCLFHETRVVAKAVRHAVKAVRARLPPLPPRLERRAAAGVRREGADDRLPAPSTAAQGTRDTGVRVTLPAAVRRRRGRCVRAVRQAGIATVQALRTNGCSIQGIARETGISRPTVRAWLQQPSPTATDQPLVRPEMAWHVAREAVAHPAPPPAPWTSGEQVRRVHEGVGANRYRLLCRPEHLTDEDHTAFATLFTSPVGGALRLARSFLEDWYQLWRDETDTWRSPEEAYTRFERWRRHPGYATLPHLRRIQQRMDDDHFARLIPMLCHRGWEGTNNGAERIGRTFRHLQTPRFGLRTDTGREAALVAHVMQGTVTRDTASYRMANRCTRGRKRRVGAHGVAA